MPGGGGFPGRPNNYPGAPVPVAPAKVPKGPSAFDKKNLQFAPIKQAPIMAPKVQFQPTAPNADLMAMRSRFLQGQKDDVNRASVAARQETDDMLNRRFAQIGQQGSGAAMGMALKAREGLDAQRSSEMNKVAGLEAQAMESDLARSDQMAARLDSQNMAMADMGLKTGMFNTEQGNRLNELDMARKQLLFDRSDTEFNKWLSQQQLALGAGGGGGGGK